MSEQTTTSTEDISHTITEIAMATNTQTEDTESTATQMNALSESVQGVMTQLEEMNRFAEDTLADSEKVVRLWNVSRPIGKKAREILEN